MSKLFFIFSFLMISNSVSAEVGGLNIDDIIKDKNLTVIADLSLTGYADNYDYAVSNYLKNFDRVVKEGFNKAFSPYGCVYETRPHFKTLKSSSTFSWSEVHAYTLIVKLACPAKVIKSLSLAIRATLHPNLKEFPDNFDDIDVPGIGDGSVVHFYLKYEDQSGVKYLTTHTERSLEFSTKKEDATFWFNKYGLEIY